MVTYLIWFLGFVVLVAGEDGHCQPLMKLSHLPNLDVECWALRTQSVPAATRLGCGAACHHMNSCPDRCVAFTVNETSSTCTMCLMCPVTSLTSILSGDIWAETYFLNTTGIFILSMYVSFFISISRSVSKLIRLYHILLFKLFLITTDISITSNVVHFLSVQWFIRS